MGLYLRCDARAPVTDGTAGVEHHWGLTREKSAGNPSEGAAPGKCTLSHLDLSCSVCSADEAEVHPELRRGGAAPVDEL